jgi:hypothetical protein
MLRQGDDCGRLNFFRGWPNQGDLSTRRSYGSLSAESGTTCPGNHFRSIFGCQISDNISQTSYQRPFNRQQLPPYAG